MILISRFGQKMRPILVFLTLLLTGLLLPSVATAQINLPAALGTGTFSSCSLTTGTTYTCTNSIVFGSNVTLNFTQSMTLQINGNFSLVNNSRVVSNNNAVAIRTTGNVSLGNSIVSGVDYFAAGNFSTGNSADFTGNIIAGGTLTIAGGSVNGYCSPTHPRCSGVSPALSIAAAATAEGNAGTKTLSFPVTLSQSSTRSVTVNYATSDGTATVADNDFVATSGTLTFSPGQTSATINVTVNGDTKYELDESFTVTLTSPVGALLSTASATGTINNDDSSACVTSTVGSDTLVTCPGNGSVTIPAGVTTVRYLVVGGGGGGGGILGGDAGGGGGGGGGAVRTGTGFAVSSGSTYFVTVGNGGAPGVGGSNAGGTGGASSFSTITANGGAGGASQDINGNIGATGLNGGSGGGGRTTAAGGGVAGVPPLGYRGGNGAAYGTGFGTAAGGGGGAGSVGENGYYDLYWFIVWILDSIGGSGGNGVNSNISGASIAYAGGGGGGTGRTGSYFFNDIRGGSGRDGGGSAPNSRGAGTAGIANRGGGGSGATGSASGSPFDGGAGGSGIVILRYATVTGPNHIRLLHSGQGITCTPAPVEVVACANDDCSTRYTGGALVTLNTISNASWTTNPVSIGASGSAMTSLRKLDRTQAPNPVTLASSPIRCFVGATETCSMTFYDSGFLFDVPNHRAENNNTVSIRAVHKSDSSQTCVPAFAGVSKALSFTCAYSNPASGSLPIRIDNQALNSANSAVLPCDATGRSLSLAFNASGVASVALRYADVGRMTLNARHADAGLVMTGTDSFVAAPSSFALSSITAAPIKAGRNFVANVTAQNSAGAATANFGKENTPESVNLTATQCQPTGVNAHAGSFNAGSVGSFSNGVASVSAMSWSEVGSIDLTATLASGNYLASGFSASGNTGSGGVLCSGGIGVRNFIPDHFTTTVTQACVAGAFTYSGQPLTVKVQAWNGAATPLLTKNYDGSTSGITPYFAKNVTLSVRDAADTVNNPGPGGLTPVSPQVPASAFASGEATAATPTYTFTAPKTLPTAIRIRATDTDAVSSSAFAEGLATIRSGQLATANAYGSELLNLPMAFEARYWTLQNPGNPASGYYAVNTEDSCTALAASSLIFSNFSQNLAACETRLLSAGILAFSSGRLATRLSAPGAGNNGSVDLTLNIGNTPNGNTCLAALPSPATAANLSWFGPTNPALRASFGLRRTPLIYRRESY